MLAVCMILRHCCSLESTLLKKTWFSGQLPLFAVRNGRDAVANADIAVYDSKSPFTGAGWKG